MLGKIYMIPVPIAEGAIGNTIPDAVQQKTIALRCFIVENIKTARRYLRKIDREFPIDDCTFHILDKRTNQSEFSDFLSVIEQGQSIGVMSEAGCPGIADPGALIVALAQRKKYQVIPLVGPSSIFLALMGSGFDGQNFTFHGYVPMESQNRKKFFNTVTNGTNYGTQIFMDTPYRNQKLFEDILQNINGGLKLCIAIDITGNKERIITQTIEDWKKSTLNLFENKIPAMFLIGK